MELIALNRDNVVQAAPLAAAFRVALRSYKGIVSNSDCRAGETKLLEFLTGFVSYKANFHRQYRGGVWQGN